LEGRGWRRGYKQVKTMRQKEREKERASDRVTERQSDKRFGVTRERIEAFKKRSVLDGKSITEMSIGSNPRLMTAAAALSETTTCWLTTRSGCCVQYTIINNLFGGFAHTVKSVNSQAYE
jgi:hypothetical protein